MNNREGDGGISPVIEETTITTPCAPNHDGTDPAGGYGVDNNSDGAVNVEDLLQLLAAFGTPVDHDSNLTLRIMDQGGDGGIINVDDLLGFISRVWLW